MSGALSVLLADNAAAGSSWTPSDLGANLIDAWDADTGIVLSGSDVSSWTGTNGNVLGLNTLTSESAPNRPAFGAASYNSKAGVTFDATNGEYLATTADSVAFGSSSSSFFMAAQLASASAAYGRLLSFQRGGAGDFSTSDTVAAILRDNNTQAITFFQNSTPGTSYAITYDTPSRFGVVFNNTNAKTYLNNVLQHTDSASFTLAANGTISVGDGALSSGGLASMVVRRIIITKHEPSAGDLTNIDTWLQG